MNREYRNTSNLLVPTEQAKRLESNFYVEGYATTFTRYLLWEYDGIRYYEEIDPNALRGADLSDVIMQYDHAGKVLARLSNGSLSLEIDSKGLFMYADLSKSTAAKELYEEISAGLVTQMSWAFTISRDSFLSPDDRTRIRRIEQIKKVYDVSAVSIPANTDTEITARMKGFFEQDNLELQKRKLKLKLIMEVQK